MPRTTWPVLISAAFLLLISLPFVFAHTAADGQHVFGGFLLNPTDGNSYLAKMRQGLEGNWLFRLPYTAEPGAGAAINLYYVFLGHLSGWFGLGLIFTLHAARVLGAVLLCAALWRLFAATLPQEQRLGAFALALFGSGLGWVALAFGGFTNDFWVAETYPFLAAFGNAHFPLGLALQIFLVTPTRRPQPAAWALAAVLLSVVYPFGWAVAVATLAGHALLARLRGADAAGPLRAAAWTLAAGLPYAGYALWVAGAHPALAGWNAQNLTPAPPVWDLAISLSPALILAGAGVYHALHHRRVELYVLAAWAAVCIVLVYAPFGLQRRMISGLYIPLAALALVGLRAWLQHSGRARVALAALFLLSLPTNLVILLGGAQVARGQETSFYLTADEAAAYAWLDTHAAPHALVLAPPVYGLRLPAYADVRVWYGHPFETVDAALRLAEIDAFFVGEAGPEAFASRTDAAYVLQGPDAHFDLPDWQTVFEQGGVRLLGRQ